MLFGTTSFRILENVGGFKPPRQIELHKSIAQRQEYTQTDSEHEVLCSRRKWKRQLSYHLRDPLRFEPESIVTARPEYNY